MASDDATSRDAFLGKMVIRDWADEGSRAFADRLVQGAAGESDRSVWLAALAVAEAKLARERWMDWPGPGIWQDQSQRQLLTYRRLQWHLLTVLWARGPAGFIKRSLPLNPEDLGEDNFVKWERLGDLLQELRTASGRSGEPTVLAYLQPDGMTEAVVGFIPTEDPGLLGLIRDAVSEVSIATGLRDDQAIAFLLCDAPVTIARISVGVESVLGPNPPVRMRMVSPSVTADEVRMVWQEIQKYFKQGGKLSHEDLMREAQRWRSTARQRPGPGKKTLFAASRELVDFVQPRRADGIAWDDVLGEWAEEHPAPSSLHSFQQSYYRAARRWGPGEHKGDEE